MSEFSPEFNRLNESGKFTLRGTQILVEVLKPQELKTASGIILSADIDQVKGGIKAHTLEHGVVLAIGQGDYDFEKREYLPLDIKVGAVVVLPQYDKTVISMFPGMLKPTANKIAIVRAERVLGFYESEQEFEAAQKVINQG